MLVSLQVWLGQAATLQSELIGKRLDLLREVTPHLRRLVIMANAGYAMPMLEAQEAKATAQALGLEAARLEIWGSEDIAPAFAAIRGKADAVPFRGRPSGSQSQSLCWRR